MKHLAKIQVEFLKTARKWDDLSYDEQRGYLQRHPKTKRRLTARPMSDAVHEQLRVSNPMLKEGDIVEDYNGHRMTVLDSSLNFEDVEKYDSTGAGRETYDPETSEKMSLGGNIRYVAVKDDDGETYVYVYGDSGVTKIKDNEVSKAERVLRDGKIIKALNDSNNWKWYKLDEKGRLWSANNDWNWTIDSKQKLPKKGYVVVGPQLQTFDTKGENNYFKLTDKAPAFVNTGKTVPTGAYYGASQLFKPVYEYKMLPVATEIQQLAGGTFAIINGERKGVRFTNPDSDPHPFEKQYGYDATKVQLPLSVMKQLDSTGRIIISQPKKLNIPEFGKKETDGLGPNLDDRKHELARLDTAENIPEGKKREVAVADKIEELSTKKIIPGFENLGDLSYVDIRLVNDTTKPGRKYLKAQRKDDPKVFNTVVPHNNGYIVNTTSGTIDNPSNAVNATWYGHDVLSPQQVLKYDAFERQTPKVEAKEDAVKKKKGFPTDEIINSMKSLFRGQGDNYGRLPEAEDDDAVHYGIRDLGSWIDRPGEEDDDYPEWDEASAKKYITEFREWAKRQSWFDPKTMETVVQPGEKRWVEFYIQKKKKHLAKIQIEFLKEAGFMGLKHWYESDTAADFVDKLIKVIKKNKNVNELIATELNDPGNEWNTSGAVNVALAIEAEGQDTGEEEDNIPPFSHLLNRKNVDSLKDKLKEEMVTDKKHAKRYMEMFKHVMKKQNRKQKVLKHGPKGGKYYESGKNKIYV